MLNDAVSIVSFKTMASFYSVSFTVAVFFKAVGTFLLIFLGSTVIGLLMAALVSLILRRTDIGRDHKPLEIVFVVGGAYLSYFIPDFASLSGIVSIFFYGIASRHYTYYVLSEESQHGSHWIFEYVSIEMIRRRRLPNLSPLGAVANSLFDLIFHFSHSTSEHWGIQPPPFHASRSLI